MNCHILTLFPQMVLDGLRTSILGRAEEKGVLSLKAVNIRDFSENKHNRVDDAPYGGGTGDAARACLQRLEISDRKTSDKSQGDIPDAPGQGI